MVRWAIALVWLWSACAALGQPAVAQARALSSELSPMICDEGAQTVLLVEDLGAVRAHHWVEERGGSLGSLERAPAASGDEQLAWCVSPDDPRCAPRDAGAPLQVQRAQAPVYFSITQALPEPMWLVPGAPCAAVQLGAPRAGVQVQLERPPEA